MRLKILAIFLFGLLGGCCASGSTAPKLPTRPAPPKTVFIDSVGSALSVVYLCDTSASMKSRFKTVCIELKESINELDSFQLFDVICFQNDQVLSLFNGTPQVATGENKKAAIAFIEGQLCIGNSRPTPAMKLALGEKNDLVYLLSGGLDEIDDQESLIRLVTNADKRTRINCIQFSIESNRDADHLMKTVADSGRGLFKQFHHSEGP